MFRVCANMKNRNPIKNSLPKFLNPSYAKKHNGFSVFHKTDKKQNGA